MFLFRDFTLTEKKEIRASLKQIYGISWLKANKIVDLVMNGKCSLVDFYKGKFSIDDIASWRLDTLISKEKIIFPLFFPEMLLFMVGIGRQGFTHENFMAYMQEKYAGDISVDDLKNVKVVQAFSKLKIFVMMWRDIENYLPIH